MFTETKESLRENRIWKKGNRLKQARYKRRKA